MLFVAAADIAFFGGSLFHGHGVGRREIFVTCLTILLNVILLAGLIYRQKHGPGNIGFESVLMLVLYVAGFSTLALAMGVSMYDTLSRRNDNASPRLFGAAVDGRSQ